MLYLYQCSAQAFLTVHLFTLLNKENNMDKRFI